jgi:hypothetical protein
MAPLQLPILLPASFLGPLLGILPSFLSQPVLLTAGAPFSGTALLGVAGLGLEGAIQFFPVVLLVEAVGVIGGVSGGPEGLVEGVEAVGGGVMGVQNGGGMGRGVAMLLPLGLAVHLVEAVLLVGEEAKGRVQGLLARLPLDQLVHLQDDLLSHSVNISL